MLNRLTVLDWSKWVNNTLLFISPLATIYLVSVIANINNDGFAWSDFAVNNLTLGAMVLYVLNVLLDFFKKYRSAGK